MDEAAGFQRVENAVRRRGRDARALRNAGQRECIPSPVPSFAPVSCCAFPRTCGVRVGAQDTEKYSKQTVILRCTIEMENISIDRA
jgi:hypothetical protein